MDAATFLAQQPKTVADMICHKCQEYQAKFGTHPDIVAVNIELKEKLLRQLKDEQRMVCGTVVFFTVVARQDESLADKNWLALGDFFGNRIMTL